MHTSMMNYKFNVSKINEACEIWKNNVLVHAKAQPGFIRMQFYTKPDGSGLAIGTWKEKKNAEDFMHTGVFQKLMEKLEALTVEKPKPSAWELKYFEQV